MQEEGGFLKSSNKKDSLAMDNQGQSSVVTPVLLSWLVSQFKNIQGDTIILDKKPCDTFKVTGQVVNVKKNNSNFIVYIDDGTAVLEVICNKKFDSDKPMSL